ncbi:hypothetical protein KSC_042630 [Ktedonobacter sp. SOSP1-52]|uniref:sensor histidine kinase n=1 Tax=Ktedonobacter sp. SOSP1-52 TaxID=2778366 RepID=UPI0019161D14|nr:ATP-binding protein [Ktedonobacter sp. SOSP1-52]GHO65371.1 hypothetical protein KSC_042630 [Ktedonobacter sp. SOSP1-52]
MEHQPSELFQRPTEQDFSSQTPSAFPGEVSAFTHKGPGRRQDSIGHQEPAEEERAHILHDMAQMTAQSFQSSQEAMRVALEMLGRFLDCQTLFVARVGMHQTDETICEGHIDAHTLKIMEARNQGTSIPAQGAEGPLKQTYCQTIWRTQRPLIVEDSTCNPYYQQLPTTEEYNIGSYIGVPLLYSDGRVYGTLCSQDPHPRPLTQQPEKLELMQIVARFLISHIEREELMEQLRAAEKTQAELARREQQARLDTDQRVQELEAIFEAMGDGMLVCDSNGLLRMNDAALPLLSVVPSCNNIHDFLDRQSGRTVIWDEDGHPIAPEDIPIMRVLRGERLVGEKTVIIQRENARGERRFLGVSGRPICDLHGHDNGGVLIFRDITERYLLGRRTHETLDALLMLAESLARLPETQPTLSTDVSSSDQASSLRFTCQCLRQLISVVMHCQDVGILSFDPETVTWHLLNEGDSDQVQEAPWWHDVRHAFASSQERDTDCLRNNEIVMHELSPQKGLDTPLMVEAPMFLGNRMLGALVLISPQNDDPFMPIDYTLIKTVAKLTGLVYEREHLLLQQAEARAHALALQETNRRFNEFLSIASHELKNPLTGLKGNIQLAQRSLRTLRSQRMQEQEASAALLEKMQRYLERSEQQVHVQSRLASDLLDVSRIRAGTLELHMQPCDIGQVVREVVEDQRQITGGRMIILKQPDEKLLIHGDAERLGQVVNNYVTNAHKYSAFERPIEVTIMTEGPMVRVTVSDQGPGLTPDEQKRIWERFYRAKGINVMSGNGLGLGLGLHICKTIVEQHGGCVGLQSTPGQGSDFCFTLPLSADQAPC